MKIEKLNWDSDFFGLKIGKLSINHAYEFDYRCFIEEAHSEKYELIYVFSFQNILPLEIVSKADLELVDIQITMVKNFDKEKYLNIPYDFRTKVTETEKIECYKIAEETAFVSRFYKERNIGPVLTKKLYRKWIDNAINQTFSDGLFIDKESKSISGIHLIRTDNKNKIGYFTLTGVNPKFKRMGIGSKLWMQSFSYWANDSGISSIQSSFSLQNFESFNFHVKMGFKKIIETKFIYHFRNANL